MNHLSLIENLLLDISSGKVVPLRQRINAYEDQARRAPQVKLTVLHHFGPGVYMRELHIPAGIIVTGKIHKYQALNILTKGEIITVVDGRLSKVKAPHIQLAPEGMKRIGFTVEDSSWITVHPNPDNCQDTEELEKRFVCDDEKAYQTFLTERDQKCLS